MPAYTILEAPSALGHVPGHLGVERAPQALLTAGLADGLAVRRAGRVGAGGYSPVRDEATGILNPQALAVYSGQLADALAGLLDRDEFPVVLDGDADFYQPEVNPLDGAASASDLAFATGRGPAVVCDLEGRGPLVRDDDVVVFASRDAADRERRSCQPLPPGLLEIDRNQVRRLGAAAAAQQAVSYLTRDGGPAGFWIHLDADVFDQSLMQAVDDPRPGGLAWDEAVTAISTAIASGRALGLQVAIYNPDIDPDGTNGRGLAAAIRAALAANP
jgi:arginase